ncbi:MAG: FecR family protein [Tannerellaceae bacterium]|jgi:ferric-dicitrate binding protein FerR (iron transport regulator)|nr:FecR family protein [Tannerellaceae bacterium]
MEELLNRYFAEALPDHEKSVLFDRLEQDEALKAEYVRLQNTMAISGMISRQGDEHRTVESFRKMMRCATKRRRSRMALSVMKYAAAVLILIATWFLSKEYTSGDRALDYMFIEAPKGQRVYLTLADGTEAWLSSRTQLKVPNGFGTQNRTVELDGEGFFSVSKNKQKPFVVQTKQHSIQVTGTQFNVFAYSESEQFETDLIEGAVFVFDKDRQNDKIHLLPNEKVFVQSGKLVKSTSSFIQSQYIKNGIYSFENQSLRSLAQRLELWYEVKIHITKPEMGDYHFSGKFRQTDDIIHILRAVKETGKFDYLIVDEKQIEIY